MRVGPARRGYQISLWQQTSALSTMANFVGSARVNRDKKGDPNGRPPIEVIPAGTQRAALQFILDNGFRDEAFGLPPQLLQYMTVDKWWDEGGFRDIFEDPTWPVHDRILGIQASLLTAIMNPQRSKASSTTSFRVASEQEMFTLAELMNTVAARSERDRLRPSKNFTNRQPMVSSLRRNL